MESLCGRRLFFYLLIGTPISLKTCNYQSQRNLLLQEDEGIAHIQAKLSRLPWLQHVGSKILVQESGETRIKIY